MSILRILSGQEGFRLSKKSREEAEEIKGESEGGKKLVMAPALILKINFLVSEVW